MNKNLLSVILLFCFNLTHAQSGLPDPSFGKNGIVTTNMGVLYKYNSSAKQVLIHSDGSIYINLNGTFGGTSILKRLPDEAIIVAGYEQSIVEANTSFLVARYNSNGELDNTFNGVGFRSTNAESKFLFINFYLLFDC